MTNVGTEVYRGVLTSQPLEFFARGSVVTFPGLTSTSLSWQPALSLANETQSKKGVMGVVFLVKSKTGRRMKDFSRNPQEDEVVLLPNTMFKTTNWYLAGSVCLAQKNARHTFAVMEPSALRKGDAVIIELEELENPF